MSLVTLRNIHLGFGGPYLLDGVDLTIPEGERICLLGRNGEGKSTLMKVISGEIVVDEGERILSQGTKVSRLVQEVPQGLQGSVFDVVADGVGKLAVVVKNYHQASHALADVGSDQVAFDQAMSALSHAQHALEAADGWQLEQWVETMISKMDLNPDNQFESLSGGMKRRVLLAQALVGDPDLLLLDEPTNHLDIESIIWLEEFLLGWKGSLLFVTHDRGFLKRLATQIVELDRGKISTFPGDYENYLRRRAEMDQSEAKEKARFDKRLAQEEVWIRQGIKARRTRNEGRVRKLEEMREELQARRTRQGSAKLTMNKGEGSGKLVCEVTNVTYSWDSKPLVQGLTTTILRGDKIGIVGPNGCGKSTLLALLLGQLQPDTGQIELGTKLEVAYFDQLRAQLDDDKSVLDNLAGGSDRVEINGVSQHVISYLQNFLFAPNRVRQPVRALSGGERNRLLLAKLFTKPANLLVMDEPTNDLDLETLELLEERLLEYQGTLLLVSHDRDFLDHVVTSTLVFEGNGRVGEYVGGYSDWLDYKESLQNKAVVRAKKKQQADQTNKDRKPGKLSYKDKLELESLPRKIEQLEAELVKIQEALADPNLYKIGAEGINTLNSQLEQTETALNKNYDRWAVLEDQ